jgi:acetolactate decarboxylase
MDTKFFLGIGVAVAIVFFVAAFAISLPKHGGEIPADRETLYQVSTIDALMQGVFEGVQPVGEVKNHGDFGIGTFDALDGEMIVLDGTVYQVRADGKVYLVPDNATTPLATVTYFNRDMAVRTSRPMNMTELSTTLSDQIPSENMIYAVRMHGSYPFMKVRAIPAQKKPYPTLTDAAKNQSVYTYFNTTGTVVGFYTPVFFKGLNVPGYHLHFISDDRNTGGHILDFTAENGTTVEFDVTPSFEMTLPTSGAFTGVDLSDDLSAALAKVEK